MTKSYWRCNGGHYFCTALCPFDGWGSPELTELHSAARRLESKGVVPSLVALREEDVSEGAIRRAIVVEFGSEKAVFDAISPDHYVVEGKSIKLRNAGQEFF